MRIGNIISMNISDASVLSDYGQQLEIKERIGAIRASGIPVAAIEHFVLVRQLLQVPLCVGKYTRKRIVHI